MERNCLYNNKKARACCVIFASPGAQRRNEKNVEANRYGVHACLRLNASVTKRQEEALNADQDGQDIQRSRKESLNCIDLTLASRAKMTTFDRDTSYGPRNSKSEWRSSVETRKRVFWRLPMSKRGEMDDFLCM